MAGVEGFGGAQGRSVCEGWGGGPHSACVGFFMRATFGFSCFCSGIGGRTLRDVMLFLCV